MSKMSGPRIDFSAFNGGWVLGPFANTAHRLVRVDGMLKPACGTNIRACSDTEGLIAFEPGNFPRCKKCSDQQVEGAAA